MTDINERCGPNHIFNSYSQAIDCVADKSNLSEVEENYEK